MKVFGAFVVCTAVIIGYQLYVIPETVKIHRWRVAFFDGLFKFINFVGDGAVMVGLIDEETNSKLALGGDVNFFSEQHWESKYNVKIESEKFSNFKIAVTTPNGVLDKTDLPAIIYLHGGGWSVGTIEQFHILTSLLSNVTNSVVISVGYRLAPEFPFPTPFNDCLETVQHVLQNPEKFRIDSSRVFIAGDSAGGNLAAAVNQYLSDHSKTSPIKGQILIYPVIQVVDFNLPSAHTESVCVLRRKSMAVYSAYYLNVHKYPGVHDLLLSNAAVCPDMWNNKLTDVNLDGIPNKYIKPGYRRVKPNTCNEEFSRKIRDKILNPYMSPLLAEDVSKLPPTLLIVAESDILRDESYLYYHKLKKSGVDVSLRLYEGAIHAFAHPVVGNLINPTQYNEFIDDFSQWILKHS